MAQANRLLPTCSKFSWDGGNVSWTGCQEPKDKYAGAVEDWEACRDLLPDTNSKKYGKRVRGMIFKSQIYGPARDFVRSIPNDKYQSNSGALYIVSAIEKCNSLAVLSTV